MPENNGSQGPQGEAALATEAAIDVASVRDVFISHASQDSELANTVVVALERAHLSCWIAPRDVVPGDLYADGIIRAIAGSKVIVLVLSRNAIASGHVGKEVERASSKRRPIVALRTDTSPLTPALEYFLSESQWIELNAGQTEPALAKLVDAVRRQRGAEAAKPSAYLAPQTPTTKRHRNLILVVVGLLVVVAAYFVGEKIRRSASKEQAKSVAAAMPAVQVAGPAAAIISEKSVAVLPFLDMSEKKDQEYFSDGLSEELIDMLTKVSELRVPARTSSFYFKGKSEDIPTIAKRLLVAQVLEGSVRKSGNHMRITVQLVRADTGYHLWSQTYDRQIDDIFEVQDDIASAVVKALKISILGLKTPLTTPVLSTDSYLLYLKGSALYQRNNSDDIAASIVVLKEFLQTNPDYAPAWALLTRAMDKDYQNGHGSYLEVSLAMRAAAEKAVAIDPKLPDGYLALSLAYLTDWRWDDASNAIERALILEPDKAVALKFASYVPLYRRQFDLALRYAEAALKRDPLDYGIYMLISDINFATKHYTTAESSFKRSMALNPAQDGLHARLAEFLFLKGEPAAALDEIDQEPNEQYRLRLRIKYLDAQTRSAEADAEFTILKKRFADTEPSAIAKIYSRRGQIDLAFEWLDRAYRQHDPTLYDLDISDGYNNIKLDPRFKAILRKMKLPN
jgi:TolB-like protein